MMAAVQKVEPEVTVLISTDLCSFVGLNDGPKRLGESQEPPIMILRVKPTNLPLALGQHPTLDVADRELLERIWGDGRPRAREGAEPTARFRFRGGDGR